MSTWPTLQTTSLSGPPSREPPLPLSLPRPWSRAARTSMCLLFCKVQVACLRPQRLTPLPLGAAQSVKLDNCRSNEPTCFVNLRWCPPPPFRQRIPSFPFLHCFFAAIVVDVLNFASSSHQTDRLLQLNSSEARRQQADSCTSPTERRRATSDARAAVERRATLQSQLAHVEVGGEGADYLPLLSKKVGVWGGRNLLCNRFLHFLSIRYRLVEWPLRAGSSAQLQHHPLFPIPTLFFNLIQKHSETNSHLTPILNKYNTFDQILQDSGSLPHSPRQHSKVKSEIE